MQLQHSPEKQPILPRPKRLGGTPCDANPGFSEMSSLASDEHTSLRGCATKTEGGGVRPPTGVFSSGTATHTNSDALTFPEIMGLLDRDEIVSCGESKASRDPDLRLTDLDPPLFSAPCPPNTDGLLFSKRTTRPDFSLDLAELRLDHEEQLEKHKTSFAIEPLQSDYSDHIHLPPTALRKTEIEVDIRSVASSTTINSTAHTVSIAASPPPLYEKTFLDTTPSPTGPSPITPRNIVFPRSRLVESAPMMVPGPSEPIDSRLSSSYSNSAGADAMKNMQWRPRSAPKTSNARSASPLQFWPKKSDQPYVLGDGRNPEVEIFKAGGRDSDDATCVDSVSNHLERMTPPTRPGSGDPNGRRDLSNDLMDVENRGPQPTITREEYESLPQAIQRKVRLLPANQSSVLFHKASGKRGASLGCFSRER
ncbi:hypothetical protein N0V93_003365 [Gnomoniopsis smithogilvyi]|uniref:Uncharacterized protein n=1 Tax=Gnomoniopsis smithogilvyi TaxID=1191159 RepID=A0A9W8YYF3_9PEZI|nr:hypothetical protein N0V93_003365 [Gnomoniopsis smithogilvyi]